MQNDFKFTAGNTHFDLRVEDCVQAMAQIPKGSVDVVVTSPPYNLGIKYANYDDKRSAKEYLKWCQTWASGIKDVLKEDGSLFLNLGAAPSNPLIPHDLIVRLKELFVLQNTIHWIKSITVTTKKGEMVSTGHFKPINSERYLNDCHEYVFHLTKNGTTPIDRLAIGVPYSDKSNIARWQHSEGKDKRCRGNNWFIPYQTITNRSKDRPHPATFPVQLATFCVKLHGKPSSLTMMDPFLGIGHSAQAAKECEVKQFYGFDIEKSYVKTAQKHLLGQLSLPLTN